jgi:GNAT superfamily N-acetyltransferase
MGVTDLQIRPAGDDELDTVASLVVDAYAEHAARMSPDAWSSFAQDIANVRGRIVNGQLLVAERDERIVGSVTLYLEWRGAQQGSAGVRLLAVPPDERGSGVGRALMEDCIRRAREAGKQRVVLTTTQDMESARDLYDKLGFIRQPALDHEPAPGLRSEGYELAL